MKNALKTLGIILVSGILLFVFDPAFNRTEKFADFSTEYEWRIFNNAYCNWKTHGHCADNNLNKINAERKLWKTLAENYGGEKNIKEKLENVVLSHYQFHMTYTEHLKIVEINIDSIIKHKDDLFEQLFID